MTARMEVFATVCVSMVGTTIATMALGQVPPARPFDPERDCGTIPLSAGLHLRKRTKPRVARALGTAPVCAQRWQGEMEWRVRR